jgi:hypothetical protein
MADPAIGLAPTSPLMMPPPVEVIAAPDRIAKLAVEPRFTGAGPAAARLYGMARASKSEVTIRAVTLDGFVWHRACAQADSPLCRIRLFFTVDNNK